MFIFPVKKGNGYFNMISQNQEKSFIYTFLEDYRKGPEKSSPYLVITLFDELLFKKGIVLVRGDIINELNQEDSKAIFNMTKDFYSVESLFSKVKEFNHQSRKFDFNFHTNFCLSRYFNSDSKTKIENI